MSELTHLETLVLDGYGRIDHLIVRQNQGTKNILNKIPTAIARLVNLKTLVIQGRGGLRRGEISKIENLPPNLSTLDISNNQITEIENLPQSISRLYINGNQISNLAPLIPFVEKGLEHRVNGNPIAYTPAFALYLIAKTKAAKTSYLNLECCGLHPDAPQMRDIWNALSELTHLETLVLGNSRFEMTAKKRQKNGKKNLFDKIPTAIGSLVNLKSLTIRGQAGKGKISKIENLPQSLSRLDISNNQITEIENLPQNIIELHIVGNKIFEIKNLLQNLSILDISDNQISKIENLPQHLSTLNISNNQISKIENLPQSLTMFDVSDNQISKIENLSANLGGLYINNNQISTIENLPDSLHMFSIRNNQIKDIEPLLSFIEKTDFYDFNDNLIENLPPEVVEKGNTVAALLAFAKK